MTGQINDCEIVRPPLLLSTLRRCSGVLTGAAAVGTVLTLGDQAVVSGTNFVTTLLIGRLCGPEELGLYSLGFSLVLFVLSIQQSLVTVPYTVFCSRVDPARRQQYAGSALVHWGGLSLAAMAVLAIFSAAIAAGFGPPRMAPVVRGLAVVTPFLLLRDFARSYAYAHLRVKEGLALDVTVSLVQLAGLCALFATGMLTAAAVFVVIGASALIGSLCWLWLRRCDFAASLPGARTQLRENWSFAKWLFSGNLVEHLGSETVIVWLLALTLGKSATGIFAASLSIVMFSNPFVLGMSKYLTPRISHAYAEGGARRLRQAVRHANLLMACTMGCFCFALALFGGDVMHLVYGELYRGHHGTVFVLSLVHLMSAASMGSTKGLWALNRPQLDLAASAVGLAVTAVAAPTLMWAGGVFGVACGLLLGRAVDAATRCVLLDRLVTTQLAPQLPAIEERPQEDVQMPSLRPVLTVAE